MGKYLKQKFIFPQSNLFIHFSVIFHFFRGNAENAHIWVYDIRSSPKFLYLTYKGTEYVTDKVFVHKGHVVIVPSWPLAAGAVIMTLSIENQMDVVEKFIFEDRAKKDSIDQVKIGTYCRASILNIRFEQLLRYLVS